MKVSVLVHDSAKENLVQQLPDETLRVFVKAPPTQGKANEAAVALLSGYFKKKKNQIFLVRGATSKTKTFEVL